MGTIRWRGCLLGRFAGMAIMLMASTWAGSALAQGQGIPARLTAVKGPAAANAQLPAIPPLAQIQRGREMFKRLWTANDAHTPTGDGLGPMFNARSCAECHNLGRLGGGGDNKNNVDLLSVILPANKVPLDRQDFRTRIGQFHPAFTAGTNSVRPFITLHKFGNDPNYAAWRLDLLETIVPEDAAQNPLNAQAVLKPNRFGSKKAAADAKLDPLGVSHTGLPVQVDFKLTQRNTPALFGVGLIDTIPDEAIRKAASDQAKRHSDVHGQVALAASGGVGKFGWRGQVGTLKEFVMGACENELGLQVPNNDQPLDPLDPTHKSPGLDLAQEQCDDLTAFVANISAPRQRVPLDTKEREQVLGGHLLFVTNGCAVCHMERLGPVTGIYSDLLLHDMGSEFDDPVPASAQIASLERSRTKNPPRSFAPEYYGGSSGADVFVEVPPTARRQWRTPPLWGVADSGPYLHDGRAETLQDAIMQHSGEATVARQRFTMLTSLERRKILAFLRNLTAD